MGNEMSSPADIELPLLPAVALPAPLLLLEVPVSVLAFGGGGAETAGAVELEPGGTRVPPAPRYWPPWAKAAEPRNDSERPTERRETQERAVMAELDQERRGRDRGARNRDELGNIARASTRVT